MTGAKFDIEKFDGTADFGLWRIKMRALLIQHGCKVALEVLPANMEAQAKAELNKKAHSVVILYLGNKVLRKVTRETTTVGDHLKRNCPKNNRTKSTGYIKKDDQPSSNGSIYDGFEVMMVMSAEALLDWIMDSGGSYHMTHRLDILFDFLECDGSSVLLGDNRECKIRVAVELNASVEEKDSLAQVWHKRLGHISEAGLHVLEKQELFGKKSLGSDRLCSFRLMGRVWVYILKFKHEAFGKFKEWKQLVENQTRRKVKKLRTDNGLDFCNREFEQLCIESRIARHLTVAGTPQQNELAERVNITLIDKMWSGHPGDYGMLKVFGCVAYSHVKQGKLELRAKKCILLGYPEGVKGYRLYRLDNESPKIVTSRNVVFNESVMYKDTLKDSGVAIDKSVEELQVEVELQGLNNHESNMATYAFAVAEEEDTHEPLTYQEVVACEDSSKNLEEVIYIRQPPGYKQGNKVCLLKKSLYGLKQPPRQWYMRFDEYMLSNGFKRSSYDNCIYYRLYAPGEFIYLLLDVDDMLIACKSKAEIGSTKSLLTKEFDMMELGEANKILGMEIVMDRSRKILRVSQSG
ncbi:retrotransposon protein, putative, ty1-copia subclass [Tanacetum coccineum]|uniref:Retrotransposon protein, putative, ty1-copia subclass n=1 Tax=Tanacetum coccineum TaxID=301880 RepID=A0ABQ5IZ76_9ASTR